MLITAAQKVEHYEIAIYGTVATYAQVLPPIAPAAMADHAAVRDRAIAELQP